MTRLRLRSMHLDTARALSAEMLMQPLDLIGAHTRLIALASDFADGGRIAGCKAWSASHWLSRVGFRPRYLFPRLEAASFIRWQGEDLWVADYNVNHEERIRGLVRLAFGMTAQRMAEVEQGGAIPRPVLGAIALGSQRVNCAKVLRTGPTAPFNGTVQRHRERTPDPGSGSPPFEEGSDPPGPPPHEDRARVSRSGGTEALSRPRDPGPEGFEAFLAAMPVPKERQPRDPRVWPKWIDRMLRLWVSEDLEGEAPEILAEVERMKLIEEKQRKPRMVPSGINFLRAASWRRRRPAKPRPKPAAAAEVLADASDSWKGSTPTTREELEAFVRGVINAREHHS